MNPATANGLQGKNKWPIDGLVRVIASIIFLLCFAESASAQGSLIKDIAWRYTTSGIFPASGATITVCTSTATGSPCSPKVSLFSDAALSVPVTNPLPACSVSPQAGCIDGLGNWSAYVSPGGYTYSVSGAGLTAYGPVPIYASVISGGPASFTTLTVSGTTTLSGPVTTQAFNDILWVGTNGYATCTAAFTAAGTVNKTIIAIRSTYNYAASPCPTNYGSTNPNVTLWNFNGLVNPPNSESGNGITWGGQLGTVQFLQLNQFQGTATSMPTAAVGLAGYHITSVNGFTYVPGVTLGFDAVAGEIDVFNPQITGPVSSITSITEAGSTETVTTTAPCTFVGSENIVITGASPAGHNGNWVVIAPGCNGGSTFTFTNHQTGLGAAGAAGTVTGSLILSPAEHSAALRASSIGGAYGPIYGVQGYYNSLAGETTLTGIVRGINGIGCNIIAGVAPLECWGLYGVDQGTKGSKWNYGLGFEGAGLCRYSLVSGSCHLDFEDSTGTPRQVLSTDNSIPSNTILRAATTQGLLLQDSSPANQAKVDSSGLGVFVRAYSTTPGAAPLGINSNPFSNLCLGTAATNNICTSVGATAAARTINLTDPLVATTAIPLFGGIGAGHMQTKRVAGCATAASLNATCDTTITWTTAFADANYTAVCTGDVVTSGIPVVQGIDISAAKTGAAITVRTISITAAAAQFTTIDCKAQHD